MRAKATVQAEIDKLTDVQLRELVRSQGQLIRDLESANAKLRALIYGRKSERNPYENHPLLPFAEEPAPLPPAPHVDEAPDEESDHAAHQARKKPRARGAKRLPENLPRERVVIDLEPQERQCGCWRRSKSAEI